MAGAKLAWLVGALALLPASGTAAPRVAVDIAPIHSIVARVMQGVGAPELVLPVGTSPHAYALRPSDAAKLARAEVVVWVGPALSPWLEPAIASLAGDAHVLTMEDAEGVQLLPVRAGGPFEPDLDGDEPDPAADGTAPTDPHLWLDPLNATAFAGDVAAVLGAVDPVHAAAYTANAADFAIEMSALAAEVAARLGPVRHRPYLVFHDAYQYFERRFAFPAAGSISLNAGEAPGAARIKAIRDRVRRLHIVCAFAEPQFQPKLLQTVIEDTPVKTGVLDPEGGSGAPGPDLYPAMIRAIATSLAGCLGA